MDVSRVVLIHKRNVVDPCGEQEHLLKIIYLFFDPNRSPHEAFVRGKTAVLISSMLHHKLGNLLVVSFREVFRKSGVRA